MEGARFNLVTIEKPEKGSFIQLETFIKDKNFTKIVHIVMPTEAKKQVKLGRGHDSDVKIGDISVSRVHAFLSLTPQGFILQDNNSKFGTLLLLNDSEHEIHPVNGLAVQASRTTLTCAIKKNAEVPTEMPLGIPIKAEADKSSVSPHGETANM